MKDTLHFYGQGNVVTDCLRPIGADTKKTQDVLQVTCKACQKTHTFKASFRFQYGVRIVVGDRVRVISTQEVGEGIGFCPEGVPYTVQFKSGETARLMGHEIEVK